MKKWIITIAVAAVITTVALASDSISSTQASQPGEKQETAEKKMITLQKAKELALDEVDGVVKSIELSRDDNRYYYEVDIHDGTFEYELDIDAFSGEILDFEKDSDRKNIKKLDSLLSMDEAIVIAQKEAPNASLVEVEIDRDDNRILFEVKMRDDEYDYEIDVNASTGEIVDIDKDRNEKAAKNKETASKETASKEKEVEKIELAPAPKAEKKQEKKAAPKAEPKQEKKAAPKQEKKQEKKATPKQEKKPEKKQEKKQEKKKSSNITMDQAIAIAKQHGSGVVTEVERDDGVWEIEMEDGDIEYEIDISIRTGEVVSFEKDIDD